MKLLERVAIVIVALAIAIGVIALLSGGLLAGRDEPGVSRVSAGRASSSAISATRPAPRELRGPSMTPSPDQRAASFRRPIVRDGAELSDDQLLQALAVGDVVLMYGTPSSRRAVWRRWPSRSAAPFTPALAASGQAVILARRPGTSGVLALAWTRIVHVRTANDPQLRSFALFWLRPGAQADPSAQARQRELGGSAQPATVTVRG